MSNFFKTLKVEKIKKKHSGIFTLSVILGVIIPLIYFITKFFVDESLEEKLPVNYYFDKLSDLAIPFVSFFFPILILITSSKIAQIDHKNRGWHLMETQPTTKFAIYFSKFTLLLCANLIAIISFLFFTFLFTWLVTLIKELPSHYIIDFQIIDYVRIGMQISIVSLCITALQYVLSVLIKGFIWPILIGFLSMLLPVILMKYKNIMFWYPHNMLSQIGDSPKGSDFGHWFTYTAILSILYTIILLYIGFNWYRFKGVVNAFFKTKINLLKLISIVLIIGVLVGSTIKPRQQKSYHKTIIAGKTETDKDIKKVYVFERFVKDTIAKIDVVGGVFHHEIKGKLRPNYYSIKFEYYNEFSLFFGSKDSLNIHYTSFGKNGKIEVKGTRLVENILKKKRHYYDRVKMYLDKSLKIKDADFFMDIISEEWKKELYRLRSKRSIDNIIVREDFSIRAQKEINLKYITYWNRFKKLRKSLYPNKEYNLTNEIIELEQSISMTDISMLSNEDYFSLVKKELIYSDKRELNEDEKYFEAISKLNNGIFKDKLLFSQLKKNLEETTSINVRDSLMAKYVGSIKKQSYKELLFKKHGTFNKLSKGVSAPNFKAYNKDKKEYQLTDFIGKYVIIDVWASWCGPCIRDSPYFEKKALKYKNDSIVFIAMNVDEKEKKWLFSIEDKGQSVLQLRIKNKKLLVKKYDILSIPRYILIDKEGKLIDVDFERPINKNFDELLNMYMK